MREIKFRQPVFIDGKFHEWHYWGFIKPDFFVVPFRLDDSSQQFTGLLDSKNKEIYEGDIIKDFNVFEVKYEEENCSCCDKIYGYCFGGSRIKDWHINSEIIGNIYENPELLDKKQ